MADIRTHLRELSVAITIGLLKNGINFRDSDLYDSEFFYKRCCETIDTNIKSIHNLREIPKYEGELKVIIDNGIKLGKKIYSSSEFIISKNDIISWIGNDTQKGNPVDMIIGNYMFSLKENSFILENMGLYSLLNYLTNSNYSKGLHIFNEFALAEYDKWFVYTWNEFICYLQKNSGWNLINGNKHSYAKIVNDKIVLSFNGIISKVPISISSNKQYISYTNSITREKVLSKWINENLYNDNEYINLKKLCSTAAGEKLTKKIISEYKNEHIYSYLRVFNFTYYYAKTTQRETTILKVPCISDFNLMIEFCGCRYDVPRSQLNIITSFKNKITNSQLEFRNECRFSHGQFNGTPEAKMYVTKNTSLISIYLPINY